MKIRILSLTLSLLCFHIALQSSAPSQIIVPSGAKLIQMYLENQSQPQPRAHYPIANQTLLNNASSLQPGQTITAGLSVTKNVPSLSWGTPTKTFAGTALPQNAAITSYSLVYQTQTPGFNPTTKSIPITSPTQQFLIMLPSTPIIIPQGSALTSMQVTTSSNGLVYNFATSAIQLLQSAVAALQPEAGQQILGNITQENGLIFSLPNNQIIRTSALKTPITPNAYHIVYTTQAHGYQPVTTTIPVSNPNQQFSILTATPIMIAGTSAHKNIYVTTANNNTYQFMNAGNLITAFNNPQPQNILGTLDNGVLTFSWPTGLATSLNPTSSPVSKIISPLLNNPSSQDTVISITSPTQQFCIVPPLQPAIPPYNPNAPAINLSFITKTPTSGSYPFVNKAPSLPTWTGTYNHSLAQNAVQGPYRTATARWGQFQASHPKPTNRWFVTSTFAQNNELYPLNSFPFILNITTDSLQVCCPAKPTINPNSKTTTPKEDQIPNYIVGFVNNLEFFAPELENQTTPPTIISPILNQPLSVTYQWGTAQKGFIVPIVRGMPYVTIVVNHVTPCFTTVNAISSINGIEPQMPSQQGQTTTTSTTSDHFIVKLNNGHFWHILTSQPITLNCFAHWNPTPTPHGSMSFSLQATQPFVGTIRTTEQQIFPDKNPEALIKQYKNCYPIDGTVNFAVSGDSSTVNFNWNTGGTGDLLMMSLPHHQKYLKNPMLSNITFDSVRGKMLGVTGKKWTMSLPLPTIQWNSPTPIDPSKKTAIIDALTTVNQLTPSTPADQDFIPGSADDSYGFGKEIAKLARIGLIAQQLDQTAAVATILKNMQTSFAPWINSSNADPLKYDAKWGGVCTKNGLLDSYADYGMGWYNDHHFHFGYFIYAAAAFIYLGKGSQQYQPFITQLTSFIYDLIRDIANPAADSYFPDYRMIDWYLGHSLAAGLFPFASGKNQESSSEAVNAWYGIYLFGLATNNQSIQDLGRTLLATETLATQTYWFLVPKTSTYASLPNYGIYPEDLLYAKNQTNPCVGILWETMADFQTFFNDQIPATKAELLKEMPNFSPTILQTLPDPLPQVNNHPIEYVNLIHFLPFTPITQALIPQAWNSFQYGLAPASDYQNNPAAARTLVNAFNTTNPTIKIFRTIYPTIWESWKGYIYMSLAISNPTKAWSTITQADPLHAYDVGNSATNMLYWVATQPAA